MNTRKVAPWIFPGARLKTRTGFEARIYAVDGGGRYPVHGAIFEHGAWANRFAWTAGGNHFYSGAPSLLDLMEPTPEPTPEEGEQP